MEVLPAPEGAVIMISLFFNESMCKDGKETNRQQVAYHIMESIQFVWLHSDYDNFLLHFFSFKILIVKWRAIRNFHPIKSKTSFFMAVVATIG